MRINPVYIALGGIIAAAAIATAANGLLATFLPVRMRLEGFSTTAIGAVVACYSVGFLGACLVVPRIVRAVGHVRCFMGCAVAAALAALLFPLVIEVAVWMPLRVVTGFCVSGMFICVESWIIDRTPNEIRGQVFGAYVVQNKITYAGGQVLLIAIDPSGITLFLIASVLFVLCILPVRQSRASPPTLPGRQAYGLRQVWAVSPLAMFAAFAGGFINAISTGMTPVYAAAIGFEPALVAWFVIMIQGGNMLSQYPLGRLSDRFDRRIIIATLCSGATLVALAFLVTPHSARPLLMVLGFIYGAIGTTLYPLSIGHVASRVERQHLVAVNGTMLLMFGMGGIAGPVLATFAMENVGPDGMFATVGLLTASLAAFSLWRLRRRPPAGQR